MTVQIMRPELLEKFRRCVYENSDLHFSGKKIGLIERKVAERLSASGLEGYQEYYDYLAGNPDEVSALVEGLTTNQTSFFRNPGQFRALAERVLPALVAAGNREAAASWGKGGEADDGGRPAMSIKVWSAGCATGEEAYSLAFTLLDSVTYPRAWDLEVLATDIKRDALAAARRGVYTCEAVAPVKPRVRDRYMKRTEAGWSVRDEARRLVGLYAANIKDATRDGGSRKLIIEDAAGGRTALDLTGRFDVIFCRNVMIYFDRDAQQRLVAALYDCLRPGGYLFTGDSEPLHLFAHGFRRADDDALYYVKPE